MSIKTTVEEIIRRVGRKNAPTLANDRILARRKLPEVPRKPGYNPGKREGMK